MAETDILNPQRGYWAAIGDNPNPSYGFTRKTNANPKLARARLGSWYQRDNANDGYSFALSYVNRPWSTMLRLKKFYEIGKSGYFTVIDYDGGGRHHVGRFTTAPDPIQVANGKYNCQTLVFEEIPQSRMLKFPSDFVNWSRTINVVDDSINCQVAYKGAWIVQSSPNPLVPPVGGFPNPGSTDSNGLEEAVPVIPIGTPISPSVPANPIGLPLTSLQPVPSNYELYAAAAAVGDYAQVQYVGFGFQMTFRLNNAFGTWDIVVDGQTLVTALNLTNGGFTASSGYLMANSQVAYGQPLITPYVTTQGGSFVTIQVTQMPLDAHRIKIVRNQTTVYEMPNSVIGFIPENVHGGPVNGGSFQNLGNLPAAFPAVVVVV